MAIINGIAPRITSSAQDDASTFLNNAREVAPALIDGITFVYVASRNEDGIQILTLDGNGILTPVGVISDADCAGLTLFGAIALDVVQNGSTNLLVAAGQNDSGITTFTLSSSPPYLTFADRALQSDNPSEYNLQGASGVAFAPTNVGLYAFVTGVTSDGLSAFQVTSAGALTYLYSLDDNPAINLNRPADIQWQPYNGGNFLIVSAPDDDGFSVHAINQLNGGIAATFNSPSSVPFGGIRGTATTTIGNKMYIYGSDSDGFIQVFDFDGNTLTHLQTIGDPDLLNFVGELEVVETAGKKLLVASAFGNGVVNFFEIADEPYADSDGLLYPLDPLIDDFVSLNLAGSF